MYVRNEGKAGPPGRISATALMIAVGLLAGGCSTDFRRLEQPSLAPGERSPLPSASMGTRRNAGAPIGQETWTESGPRAPLPPLTAAPLSPTQPVLPVTAGLSKPFDRPKAATPSGAATRAVAASGQTIDVQAGDTLFAIAKRHNVTIADLMDANQLKSPALKPGQKLALPAATSALRRPVKPGTQVAAVGGLPAVAAAPVAERAPAPSAPSAPGEWTGSYTLKQGDSLYVVARNHKVALADLQRHNTIADPTKVRQGTVLKVPGNATAAAAVVVAAPAAAPRAAQIEAAASASAAPASGTTVILPKIINMQPAAPTVDAAKAEVAPIQPTPPIASAPAVPKAEPAAVSPAVTAIGPANTGAVAKFRWPAKGPVLANFGKRPDGAPNDGVAIGVPAGSDIAAAGDGVIAYAGSELKAYGKLILIRHDGGWVTAYAHSSDILVKRGDTVKRGQVIAKAGQTGGVDKPQVHFELRKDSKPVDPTPHMEKM